jgi:hypothetical protein
LERFFGADFRVFDLDLLLDFDLLFDLTRERERCFLGWTEYTVAGGGWVVVV